MSGSSRAAMLAGVLWFVVFLVAGTAALLAVTLVGVVLVPLGLLLSPALALALGLLPLRHSKSVPTEPRPGVVEMDKVPAPWGRAMPQSPPASGEAPEPVVKRAA